jgi:hypothetical protein
VSHYADNYHLMVLYILAGIGAVTVIILVLALVLLFFGWLGQPVSYLVRADEMQRYLVSWGRAIAEGGRIQVGQPQSDRSVTFVKRHYKKAGEQLVFRFRNAEDGRRYFEQVESAFSTAIIPFEVERTPTGRRRAIVIPFPLEDPLMVSAAAHASQVALVAMGAPGEGPFELKCTGAHRPDYVRGASDFIPWTRGHRAGFRVAQVLSRLLGRS